MKKYIVLVSILWLSSFLLFITTVIIADFKPFTSLHSTIVIFICSVLILTAMLIQTLKNKNIDHVKYRTVNKNINHFKPKTFDENTLKQANKNIFMLKIVCIATFFIVVVFNLVSGLLSYFKK